MRDPVRSMLLPVSAVLILFSAVFCGKKLSVEDLIIGRWALTGNDCDSEGRCRDLYKFMGREFYDKNGKSMVMEFRSGGTMSQPILGEGVYRFDSGILKIGLPVGGETVWNDSRVEFITMDEMVMRFRKEWRRYRRIR